MGKKFPRSLWGYRPSAVDEYIDGMVRDAEGRVAHLRAEAESVSQSNAGLKDQIEGIQKEIDGYREKERAVAQAIIAAQMRAGTIEEDARKAVEEQKRRVLAEIAVKRAEMDGMRKELERFKSTFSQVLNAIDESLNSPPVVSAGDIEESLKERPND